jgi:hypothetical protein
LIRSILRKLLASRRGYPLERTDTCLLPEDYEGLVITSDIDKTYLHTSFSSLDGIFRTAVEDAEDKRSIPGMTLLFQALQKGLRPDTPINPLYFVSASPRQMRKVLLQKFQIDGLEVSGLTLKRWGRLMRRARFHELRRHITYKLTALLLNREARPPTARIDEILFGDDSESDAYAYLLYSDIVHQKISLHDLYRKLQILEARDNERDDILRYAQRRDQSNIARIYIHCITRRKPELLNNPPSPLMLAVRNSLQIAIDAHLHHWISRDTVAAIAQQFPPEEREFSLRDAEQRNLFPTLSIDQLHRIIR